MEIQDHQFSTLIGDIKIFHAGARFNAGEKKIAVTTLVGDARITVPDKVSIKLSTQCLLGDIRFDDLKRNGFFQKLDHADNNYELSEKKLLLNVTGLIGDLEILRVRMDDVN
jgi:predicted membrane protein